MSSPIRQQNKRKIMEEEIKTPCRNDNIDVEYKTRKSPCRPMKKKRESQKESQNVKKEEEYIEHITFPEALSVVHDRLLRLII